MWNRCRVDEEGGIVHVKKSLRPEKNRLNVIGKRVDECDDVNGIRDDRLHFLMKDGIKKITIRKSEIPNNRIIADKRW
jgi:hypothetical protein